MKRDRDDGRQALVAAIFARLDVAGCLAKALALGALILAIPFTILFLLFAVVFSVLRGG